MKKIKQKKEERVGRKGGMAVRRPYSLIEINFQGKKGGKRRGGNAKKKPMKLIGGGPFLKYGR